MGHPLTNNIWCHVYCGCFNHIGKNYHYTYGLQGHTTREKDKVVLGDQEYLVQSFSSASLSTQLSLEFGLDSHLHLLILIHTLSMDTSSLSAMKALSLPSTMPWDSWAL